MTAPDPGFWRGRRVLVTGHTGFKGAWLCLWLQALGAEVSGFSDGVPTEPSLYGLARVGKGMARSTDGDVRDAAAVHAAVRRARPQLLVHLAAQSLVRRGLREPALTYDVNVLGTARVLDAANEAGVPATIVVTSDKCYANDERGRPFGEDDPLGGRDPYSSSKAAQELVAAAYRESLGLRVATARAGNVIGGGDWAPDRLVADVMRAALAGAPVVLRNPDAVRPWQHVLNPLSGYLRLAERLEQDAGTARAWNFGPAEEATRSAGWLAGALAERWPGGLELRVAPDGGGPEARTLALDSGLARERLGWRPPVDLAIGLDLTVAWYEALRRGEDVRRLSLTQIAGNGA